MHVSACVGERERERERGRCCINPAYSSSSSSSRLGLGIYCSLFYYCQTLFSLIKDPREKRSREDEESKRRSQPCSPGITSSWTHWCGQSRSRKHTLQPSSLPRGQACFFFFSPPRPPHRIGNYSTCRAVAMGLAGRAVGTLGVSRGAPLLSLWRIALLLLPIWELDAQTAVETKSVYIWQTGTVHPLYSFSTSPLGFRGWGASHPLLLLLQS